jgi:hypothetical protein
MLGIGFCRSSVAVVCETPNGTTKASFVPPQFWRRYCIYDEIIKSYNSGLTIACAIVIRALLEGICASKGITDDQVWGLEEKLKLLCQQKHVPTSIINALLGMKIIGDVAAHRLERPSQVELRSAIELIEILLDFMYEIEPRVLERADFVARLTRRRILDQEEAKQARKQQKSRNKKQPDRELSSKSEPSAG